MTNNALLVLENPWWTPEEDPKRTSVLPFLQGLERSSNNFNIYYATFYNNDGLKNALQKDLIHTIEERQILYIGAHGDIDEIAGDEARVAMNLISKFGKRIEGVMLSCCFVGKNKKILKRACSYNKIGDTYGANWLFSYKYAVDWLPSMMVDLAILEQIFMQDKLKERDKIINSFKKALSLFNKSFEMATDENEKSRKLCETIKLIVRGRTATTPMDLTETLLQELNWGKYL